MAYRLTAPALDVLDILLGTVNWLHVRMCPSLQQIGQVISVVPSLELGESLRAWNIESQLRISRKSHIPEFTKRVEGAAFYARMNEVYFINDQGQHIGPLPSISGSDYEYDEESAGLYMVVLGDITQTRATADFLKSLKPGGDQ